jgi:hypothetical protein
MPCCWTRRSTLDGLTDLIARLRKERPTLKIVAMGPPLDPDDVQAIIGAGAKGYLPETAGESRDPHGDGGGAGWLDLGAAQGAGAVDRRRRPERARRAPALRGTRLKPS